MNIPILNRAFQKPADDWYQIVPKGEYPGVLEKKGGDVKVVQIVDDQALSAMARNFKRAMESPSFPGVLVDFDHFSYDQGKSSEAAGWINELQPRSDGLWAKIRWSDLGETAVTNGRYRMVSPVWLEKDLQPLPGDRVRPTRLDSVAITNSPNMKGMAPLSNREEFRRGPGGQAAGSNKQTNQRQIMKSVATFIGLSAEASEEAILAAVTQLKNRLATAETELTPLKNRVTALETDNTALLGEQIDSDLATHGIKDEEALEQLRPMLIGMKNREARIKFITQVVKSEKDEAWNNKAGRMLNRADGQRPNGKRGAGAADDEDPSANAAKIRNRAVELQGGNPNRKWDDCWNQASTEAKK